MAADPELTERVRRWLAGRVDAEEKRMVGGLSWSVGGRMCCGVTGPALMVRVGADGVGPALAEPHVRPMELGGRPLRAYVLVDPEGCADDIALGAWLERGLAAGTDGR
jgi:hypothetical protein